MGFIITYLLLQAPHMYAVTLERVKVTFSLRAKLVPLGGCMGSKFHFYLSLAILPESN